MKDEPCHPYLEDLTGRIDVVAFPESFKRYSNAFARGTCLVKGVHGGGDSRRISLSE